MERYGVMRLFLYGTLLAPGILARFAGRPLSAAPVELPGWRRVYLRGTRYPTLRRARGCTKGALVQVDPGTLRRLIVYEGARYRLVPVRARCGGRAVRAHAWIAAAGTGRDWP